MGVDILGIAGGVAQDRRLPARAGRRQGRSCHLLGPQPAGVVARRPGGAGGGSDPGAVLHDAFRRSGGLRPGPLGSGARRGPRREPDRQAGRGAGPPAAPSRPGGDGGERPRRAQLGRLRRAVERGPRFRGGRAPRAPDEGRTGDLDLHQRNHRAPQSGDDLARQPALLGGGGAGAARVPPRRRAGLLPAAVPHRRTDGLDPRAVGERLRHRLLREAGGAARSTARGAPHHLPGRPARLGEDPVAPGRAPVASDAPQTGALPLGPEDRARTGPRRASAPVRGRRGARPAQGARRARLRPRAPPGHHRRPDAPRRPRLLRVVGDAALRGVRTKRVHGRRHRQHSGPATSAGSTATASCTSPTARRTC